jgi:hypothetical protein
MGKLAKLLSTSMADRCFTRAMHVAVMPATEGYSELIADLAAKCF